MMKQHTKISRKPSVVKIIHFKLYTLLRNTISRILLRSNAMSIIKKNNSMQTHTILSKHRWSILYLFLIETFDHRKKWYISIIFLKTYAVCILNGIRLQNIQFNQTEDQICLLYCLKYIHFIISRSCRLI